MSSFRTVPPIHGPEIIEPEIRESFLSLDHESSNKSYLNYFRKDYMNQTWWYLPVNRQEQLESSPTWTEFPNSWHSLDHERKFEDWQTQDGSWITNLSSTTEMEGAQVKVICATPLRTTVLPSKALNWASGE